jgi:hypothetical protein
MNCLGVRPLELNESEDLHGRDLVPCPDDTRRTELAHMVLKQNWFNRIVALAEIIVISIKSTLPLASLEIHLSSKY